MKQRILISGIVIVILAASGIILWPNLPWNLTAQAAPADMYYSPIHGGCYIAAPNQCRLHVDPFTANMTGGSHLVEVQLKANGNLIYHFKTDISSVPNGNFTPSLVMQDFAATCGTTYTITLFARDSGSGSLGQWGQTGQFTCPSAVP
jgi:hypothetical protein